MTLIELIKAEIERLENRCITTECMAEELLSFIESQENAQPQGLDEAAEEYAQRIIANGEDFQDALEDAVKYGAMWQAEQGVSMKITEKTKWEDIDLFVRKHCDWNEVIQIKKLTEAKK